jgi:nitronate monooxygenase
MSPTDLSAPILTPLARRIGLRYPIVAAPMFLLSNADLIVACAEAGILGSMPSINCRTHQQFRDTLADIRRRTDRPFAINLTIKLTEPERLEQDFAACLEFEVPVLLTSYGNPTEFARRGHSKGALIFHDVVRLDHARKAVAAGVDGIIAVGAGAGGHAGTVSPLVLVPYLKQHLQVPILAAGGIATGGQMAAALALGADLIYVGTRFIASTECAAEQRYKDLTIGGHPEDIVYTDVVSGVPANFLRQTVPPGALVPDRAAAQAAIAEHGTKRWKDIWSAGQGIALQEEVLPVAAIVEQFVRQYREVVAGLPA